MNSRLLTSTMAVLFAAFFLATSLLVTGAFGAERRSDGGLAALESLHDLPSKWTGVAGGLLQKSQATFVIEKVRKVTHDGQGDYAAFAATYDVDATLSLGERKLAVNQISLVRYRNESKSYEAILRMDDELVRAVQVAISYDETSDTYLLREIMTHGERRFSLSAPAKH